MYLHMLCSNEDTSVSSKDVTLPDVSLNILHSAADAIFIYFQS